MTGEHSYCSGGDEDHDNICEPDSPLCRSALIEWHLLSRREKSAQGIRKVSHSSGISTSTTQTSCVREEDSALVPPLVQNTSLSSDSRIRMKISGRELNKIRHKESSRSSTQNNEGAFCGEESNSSFASQSSDHLYQTIQEARAGNLGVFALPPMPEGEHNLSFTSRLEDDDTTSNETHDEDKRPQATLAGRLNMKIMREAAIASMEGDPLGVRSPRRSGKADGRSASHYEAIDVIKAMTGLAGECNATMRDVFNHFDRDKDGVLDREDLLMMIRQLIPSLSVHERCYLIENLISFDSSAAGRISYPDVKKICVLIGAQTSPGSSNVIRGWPSAVHTSEATIHSSDFSKSTGSCAQTHSKVSSYSHSSYENHGQWQSESDAKSSDCLDGAQEKRDPVGVTPLNKARRRSSLMLGDALLQVNFHQEDDLSNSECLSPKMVHSPGPRSPQRSRSRHVTTDDAGIITDGERYHHNHQYNRYNAPARHQEEEKVERVQTFLGSTTTEMKLMARGELPAVLKEAFQKIYADGSDFLQVSSSSEMSMNVSKWCKSFVHGGYIRTIKLVTQHPRLGTLQTLDTQRMVWGKDKKTLIVENRTMTPDFPHGLQWRVERRCVYVQVSPGIVLLTITAGVHIIHAFHKVNQLQKAVERTLPEDARSHFQAIYNTILIG